jgi:hypothetical protein
MRSVWEKGLTLAEIQVNLSDKAWHWVTTVNERREGGKWVEDLLKGDDITGCLGLDTGKGVGRAKQTTP